MGNLKIERDARVVATDGEVGRVSHVVVDRDTREVTDIVVDRGGHELVIPIDTVSGMRGDQIMLGVPRAGVPADAFDRDQFREVDDDVVREETARRAAHGGTLLLDADDDAVFVANTTSDPATPRPADRPPTSVPRAAERTDTLHVPLAVERLEVAKREVELGAVEVRKTVVTEEQTIPIEVIREELHVEVVSVDPRTVTDDAGSFQQGTLRIPVFGEDAFVRKEAFVSNEVVVERHQATDRETVSGTVRSERVTVDEHQFRPPHGSAAR